jgi:hypothetical protein
MSKDKKDYGKLNKDQITQNACSSKLRSVKVYLISIRKDKKFLSYDIIVPRRAKSKYVTYLILKHHKLKEELQKSKKYHKIILDAQDKFVKVEKHRKESIGMKYVGIPKNLLAISNEDIKLLDLKIRNDSIEENRKIGQLNSMFQNSLISQTSQDDELLEAKLQEFVIHPLVYPTLESVIRDIHF